MRLLIAFCKYLFCVLRLRDSFEMVPRCLLDDFLIEMACFVVIYVGCIAECITKKNLHAFLPFRAKCRHACRLAFLAKFDECSILKSQSSKYSKKARHKFF